MKYKQPYNHKYVKWYTAITKAKNLIEMWNSTIHVLHNVYGMVWVT